MSSSNNQPGSPAGPPARPSPEFPSPPSETGLSLDDLNAAFAEMLSTGHDPYSNPSETSGERPAGGEPDELPEELPNEPDEADAVCDVTPRSILEAMLFVGSADNQPITSDRVAGLMRGVRPAEIDDLVRELNEQYDADARPYRITSAAEGYLLVLRDEFGPIRDKYFGRTRQAKLSAAAIEVLSIIAYNGAQSADDVARLRGRPSGAVLSQLVRRQLLCIERDPAAPRRPRYQTTPRLLSLLGLESLDDLPRGHDVERR
ncbi:MAG TPA: SMC-Scp complex subunit ScpB [Pirellulales bacterium]|nr:SMC-Scp complex subunit ScpB [Pirellulales bacterium]